MNNNKFTPHSSSHQQRIIAMYLDNGLDLDTTLKILDTTCTRITQATMDKLAALAADNNNKAGQLLEKIAESDFCPCIKGRPLDLLRAMVQYDLRLKDASDKTCMCIDTANKHMAALKRHFKCKTTAALVHLATKEGFLNE